MQGGNVDGSINRGKGEHTATGEEDAGTTTNNLGKTNKGDLG